MREQIPFLLVLAVLVASFCYLIAAPRHPIRATLGIASAALLAALLRLVLPTVSAGLLAVRGRVVDLTIYLLCGVLVVLTDFRLRH